MLFLGCALKSFLIPPFFVGFVERGVFWCVGKLFLYATDTTNAY